MSHHRFDFEISTNSCSCFQCCAWCQDPHGHCKVLLSLFKLIPYKHLCIVAVLKFPSHATRLFQNFSWCLADYGYYSLWTTLLHYFRQLCFSMRMSLALLLLNTLPWKSETYSKGSHFFGYAETRGRLRVWLSPVIVWVSHLSFRITSTSYSPVCLGTFYLPARVAIASKERFPVPPVDQRRAAVIVVNMIVAYKLLYKC